MFVTHDVSARVNLAVVALGTPDRMYDALDALLSHESGHDFTVTCVVNAAGPGIAPPSRPMPHGVQVEYVEANLGWAGGLHRARARTHAELMVWVQDDMIPEAGWLDALVAAADAHPKVGSFGSVGVDGEGAAVLHNAGRAEPADQVARWNSTDRTNEQLPDEVTCFDWVTSKGLLTRTVAFDDVSGPDPRLWPLSHVDKDYCCHLRCHGWDVALVPDARLRHTGNQSAPSALRGFVINWRTGAFDEQWGRAVGQLAGLSSAEVDHPCAEWRKLTADPVEAAVGIEASRMLVLFARARAGAERAAAERSAHKDEVAEERRARAVAAYERARRRERNTRRRLERAEATVAEVESSWSWRLTGRVRALSRRLR